MAKKADFVVGGSSNWKETHAIPKGMTGPSFCKQVDMDRAAWSTLVRLLDEVTCSECRQEIQKRLDNA